MRLRYIGVNSKYLKSKWSDFLQEHHLQSWLEKLALKRITDTCLGSHQTHRQTSWQEYWIETSKLNNIILHTIFSIKTTTVLFMWVTIPKMKEQQFDFILKCLIFCLTLTHWTLNCRVFKNGTVLQTKRKQFGKPSKKIKSIKKEKFLICLDPLPPPPN